MGQAQMSSQDVEIAINRFQRRQHLLRTIFVVVLVIASVATIAILGYSSHRRSLAEAARDETTRDAHATADVTLANTANQLVTLDDALRANDRIKELAEQIRTNGNAAQQRAAREIIDKADILASRLKSSIDSSRTLQDQVGQTKPNQAIPSGTYDIVVSADREKQNAEHEVQRLKKLNFNVAVYDRQGFLRTVALIGNPDDASKQLPQIQSSWPTAYIINLDHFCPNKQDAQRQIGGAPVFTCP